MLMKGLGLEQQFSMVLQPACLVPRANFGRRAARGSQAAYKLHRA